MSHDVVFDESSSWYSLPSPTPKDSQQIVGGKASETNYLNKGDIGIIEESLISFQLSGRNETLSRNDQSDEEPTSS